MIPNKELTAEFEKSKNLKGKICIKTYNHSIILIINKCFLNTRLLNRKIPKKHIQLPSMALRSNAGLPFYFWRFKSKDMRTIK